MQVEDEILLRLEKGGRGRTTIDQGGNIEHIQVNNTDPWTEVDGERSSIKTKHPFLADPAVRGVAVERSTIYRWVLRFLPLYQEAARAHRHAVGQRWRVDETYVKIKGRWTYLGCAVNKQEKTVDFLLRPKRNVAAAKAVSVERPRTRIGRRALPTPGSTTTR